jgi:hypothetical protein
MKNLGPKCECEICEYVVGENSIKIFPDFERCCDLDLYIILYSYIREGEIALRRVTIRADGSVGIWYNASYIVSFDYVDFKAWWFKFENLLLFEEDSKINSFVVQKSFCFEIHSFNKMPDAYPIYPWSDELVMSIKYTLNK